VLTNEKFVNGSVDTYFIDENPQLFTFEPSQNRAQKLLNYLGEVLVNGPQTPLATSLKPANVQPHVPEFPAGNEFNLNISSVPTIIYALINNVNYNNGIACIVYK